MIERNLLEYLIILYEEVFNESIVDSKEFIIFVQEENPHPLRIKVENYISSHIYNSNVENINIKVFELDTLITGYIEDNYV